MVKHIRILLHLFRLFFYLYKNMGGLFLHENERDLQNLYFILDPLLFFFFRVEYMNRIHIEISFIASSPHIFFFIIFHF